MSAALWPCLIEANLLLWFPVGISSLLLIFILGNVNVPCCYSISFLLSCPIVSVIFGLVYVVNGQRIMLKKKKRTKIIYQVATVVPPCSLPAVRGCPVNIYQSRCGTRDSMWLHCLRRSVTLCLPLPCAPFTLLMTWDHFTSAHGEESR